jgi:hypothetical protein
LKYKAKKDVSSWGDAYPYRNPIEAASGNQEIQDLLNGTLPAVYQRKTDPSEIYLKATDQLAARAFSTADKTGLVFQDDIGNPHHDQQNDQHCDPIPEPGFFPLLLFGTFRHLWLA